MANRWPFWEVYETNKYHVPPAATAVGAPKAHPNCF